MTAQEGNLETKTAQLQPNATEKPMIRLSPIPARAIAESIPLPSLVHKVASQPSAGWCQRRLRREPGCSYWPVVPSSPSPLHSISGDHMRLSSIPSSNKATLFLHTGVVSEEAYWRARTFMPP